MEEEKKDEQIQTYRVNHDNTEVANLRIGVSSDYLS